MTLSVFISVTKECPGFSGPNLPLTFFSPHHQKEIPTPHTVLRMAPHPLTLMGSWLVVKATEFCAVPVGTDQFSLLLVVFHWAAYDHQVMNIACLLLAVTSTPLCPPHCSHQLLHSFSLQTVSLS